MDKDLTGFDFEGKQVRVVMADGSPWWVLKDVCDILQISNNRMVADRLDPDEKGVSLADTPGGKQNVVTINESGLYSVILRSDKPDAKRFRKWVTSEVLPAIRKTGGYLSSAVDFTDPDNLQKVFDNWKAERAMRIAAETRVSRLVHNQTTYTSTEMAKELGMKSAQELHETLRAKGIIFKDARGLWLLYSEYSGRGFQNIKQREINGSPRYYAEWTGVGRDWLVGLFANK